MNEVLATIRNRRSVRLYKEEQLQEEHLQAIIEAGLWAPSSHNTQPWHFTVIQNKQVIDHMSQVCKEDMAESSIEWVARMGRSGRHLFYQAPTIIVVAGKQEEFFNPYADCSAAIQNMLLAAESLDIGSCWIGLARFLFARPEEVTRLQLPAGYQPLYIVSLGYKLRSNGKGPERKAGTVQYIR